MLCKRRELSRAFVGQSRHTLGTSLLTNGLIAALDTVLSGLAARIHHHPKRVTATIAALMLSGAGGAFAVASLAPDASELPVREVVEAVQAEGLAAQSEALASFSFNLFRSEVTRSSDTAETLLKRMGIEDAGAAAFLRKDANARSGLLGRAGRTVSAEASDAHELVKLSVRWNPEVDGSFKRLVIEKTPTGFASRIEAAPLTASTRLAGGVIRSSLFAATDEARIPDAVATQVVEIFSSDIDFHRALRKGDRFSIVYETLEADGEPLRTGRVLSAEFVNGGKSFQAMWFQEPGQKGGYYTLAGNSLRRAYLTSPVEFSRVTSGFSMRFHPILQKWRAHLGVDYAAPTGTAVRSVGDGVVDFAGVQNGFGNVVMVKHNGNNTTVYAHLSKIGVQKGQRVSQGQTLGGVGSTGWATGPHLHFEFRVNGMHQDPLVLARQSEATPVSAAAKPAFDKLAAAFRLQLSAAGSLQQASAQ
ncbi:MAG: M23 family metallopeptidase [Bdellovibrionales bacterium]|nr:M23 family metallopeptidase [Ramlibacter sp.]